MNNDYLFSTEEDKKKIDQIKQKDIKIDVSEISDVHLWIVSYSLPGNSLEDAKKLSDVHTEVMNYSPLVLACGSSEYFNKALFPLVNELERKLRKLLYLAVSISNDDKGKESIKKLEEKDFGELFDLLFIDNDFISKLKQRVNAVKESEFHGKSKYSKFEIGTYLNELEEKPLWDRILREKDVKTLKTRFRDVQKYRNDVMHAHNIDKSTFIEAKNLFRNINSELDSVVERILGTTNESSTQIDIDVSDEIFFALNSMDNANDIEQFENSVKWIGQYFEILNKIESSRGGVRVYNKEKDLKVLENSLELEKVVNAMKNNPIYDKLFKITNE